MSPAQINGAYRHGSIYQDSFRHCPVATSDTLSSIAAYDLKSKAGVFLKLQCCNVTLSGSQTLRCINHQWTSPQPHPHPLLHTVFF